MKRYSESLEQWEQEAYHDGYGADWLADIGEGVKYYATSESFGIFGAAPARSGGLMIPSA